MISPLAQPGLFSCVPATPPSASARLLHPSSPSACPPPPHNQLRPPDLESFSRFLHPPLHAFLAPPLTPTCQPSSQSMPTSLCSRITHSALKCRCPGPIPDQQLPNLQGSGLEICIWISLPQLFLLRSGSHCSIHISFERILYALLCPPLPPPPPWDGKVLRQGWTQGLAVHFPVPGTSPGKEPCPKAVLNEPFLDGAWIQPARPSLGRK